MSHTLKEYYLDYNATTPVHPIAAKAATLAMESTFGNPSSSHIAGLRAKYILDTCRQRAREVVGAENGDIIFTSGATEGIQTTVFSSLYDYSKRKNKIENPVILYGATEHKAVPTALKHWNTILGVNAKVLPIPVDKRGQLDLNFIGEEGKNCILLCTMAVNNETGVINNMAAIEDTIRSVNPETLWMVDCVQALGKQPLDIANTTIDYAPFSGHKLYAPKGVGFLYVKQGAPYTPIIVGGGQEEGLRSGTENLPGVAALCAILGELTKENNSIFKPYTTLFQYRNILKDALVKAFPKVVFNAPVDETTVPTTLNFSVPNISSKELLDLFDAANIRVSSGSACSASDAKPSFVLEAMGCDDDLSKAAIRMSFGPAASQEFIEKAAEKIIEASNALRYSCILPRDENAEVQVSETKGLIQYKRGHFCTWLYADVQTKKCVIIDPIEMVSERIEQFITCQGYQIEAIVDTHSHANHIPTSTILNNHFSERLVHNIKFNDKLGWPVEGGEQHRATLKNGNQAPALKIRDNLYFIRLESPGHTTDSVTYLLAETQDNLESPVDCKEIRFAFCGDTLLIGGIGRTDLSNSVPEKMYATLKTLDKVICRTTLLCTAHDYNDEFVTTLATEVSLNKVLQKALCRQSPLPVQEFLSLKESLDKETKPTMQGRVQPARIDKKVLSTIDVPEEITQHPDTHVIDVRAPHEYELFQDWGRLGLKQKPLSVPLSQLSNFISNILTKNQERLEDLFTEERILFLCRSGKRSTLAAHCLARIGFRHVKSIAGGIALMELYENE